MVPMTRPRRCRTTITRLAGLSHRGSLASSGIARLLGACRIGFWVEGFPFRHPRQRPVFYLANELANPPELGLPEHQLVLGLDEEEPGQALLHDGGQARAHLPDLLLEEPHPL